ncbi:Phosphotyrosyl phosphatase activator [Pseudovirgaria hyperparasitica]|uniref:Serine/threonine-protein phosphatase 2A activator n=1 Tax=Pseudovirgaria hyperparasitica TaxID=470096 RepID=A0A6A6W6X1_9PEZI|nr:Phosphotyrosyl phosphatase activator [Pseudovirgaria hyperparasitica]KAF2757710.1 Phosphotyrosyl phosphatase activator [Pseudovirgaria hyperparasitica]
MPTATQGVPESPPDLSKKIPPLKSLLPANRKSSVPERPRSPPPQTPLLPEPPATQQGWQYIKPSRRILSPHDHAVFLASSTYDLITSFIFTLSDSVRDKPISSAKDETLDPIIHAVLQVLDEAEALIQKCPPEDNEGSRFGNKSFHRYVDEVELAQQEWHAKLGITDPATVDEISTYLSNSFGNRTRIDYGSGHELNFFTWLLCLNRLNYLPPSTFPAVILRILPRYLRLMRNVQTTYYLEPAGSHGVWGLDDYQFLPFLFGASQLYHHPYIRPKSIHQAFTLEEFGKEFMYLDQVQFVNSVKNVEGLRWHSPMLDDISAAKSWEKVEGGMRKMFVREVLGKLPVMQHFLFGSLVPAVDGMSTEEQSGVPREEDEAEGGEIVVMKDGMRHVHTANSWGDCCGIKVPSSVGAAEEMKKRMGIEGLRRIPFD